MPSNRMTSTVPTHKCVDCAFTTTATSKKGVRLATNRHYAETGHMKLMRVKQHSEDEPQELSF